MLTEEEQAKLNAMVMAAKPSIERAVAIEGLLIELLSTTERAAEERCYCDSFEEKVCGYHDIKARYQKIRETHADGCLYAAANGLEDCDCGVGTKKRTVIR